MRPRELREWFDSHSLFLDFVCALQILFKPSRENRAKLIPLSQSVSLSVSVAIKLAMTITGKAVN